MLTDAENLWADGFQGFRISARVVKMYKSKGCFTYFDCIKAELSNNDLIKDKLDCTERYIGR